ncbi:MAG: quinone-dependent dihydroorotate dehydrogenase [Pseudomonadota bacterium]
MGLADLGTSLVRRLPAEEAHLATIRALKLGLGAPLSAPEDDPILKTTLPISGLVLPNPIGLAAGFDKNAEVFGPMFRFGFGAVECGTVTPRAQAGNPKPRLFRLKEDKAVINRMGFNNQGLALYVRRLRRGGQRAGALGANVGANKTSSDRISDYVTGLEAVWPYCDYVTINISSPNTPGLRGLQDKGALEELLGRCAEVAGPLSPKRPVFLKVAPDLEEVAISDIVAVARSAKPFLTGLIVSNTTVSRPASLQSIHKDQTGGLSGAPLCTLSTNILAAFADQIGGEFDLIGVGGIATAQDAYEKILAGASAVQLYSALAFVGPGLVVRLKAELAKLLRADGFSDVREAVGKAQRG